MKKFVAVTLIGTLLLASCSGEDEEQEAQEAEGTEEESTEEENSEAEQNDDSASDESADDEAEEAESEDSSAGENDENGGNEDRDLASEDVDPDDLESDSNTDIENDGNSVDFMLNPNDELISLINEAEETDLTVEDVLKPASEVSSYYARTGLGIFTFQGDSEEPDSYDIVALDGEVDESEGLEIYVEERDLETEQSFEHGYGNSEEDVVYLHDGQNWVDQSSQSSPEEIMHGLYSNVEPVLTDLGDLLEVRETDDYHILYYLGGDDDEIYNSLGTLFDIEFTNADMDSRASGVFGIINKSSEELEHLSYVSHAPSLDGNQELQVDLVLDFLEYGNYDDAVEPPENLNLDGSRESSDEGNGSSETENGDEASDSDNLSVGDSAEIDGVTFTLDDVSYTDERNEYADIEADEVLVLSVSYENNSGEEYFPGQDLTVYVDDAPAETYPVEDVALDPISDSRNTSGNLAFAVTGDPSAIEVEFSPMTSTANETAIFNTNP